MARGHGRQSRKGGEVIARIDSRDVAASRDQAKANVGVAAANLEQARAEAREAQVDLARNAGPRGQEVHLAVDARLGGRPRRQGARGRAPGEAALAAAQANLKAAEVALDQTQIRAPFDGVVLTKSANVGDNITPFSSAADTKGAVVTIADMENARGRGRRRRVLARQGEARPALRDPARRPADRASPAWSSASCRRWTARRPRCW